MRTFMLASAAALAIATPAMATNDNTPYVGIDAGITSANRQDLLGNVVFTNTGPTGFTTQTIGSTRYRRGYDVDLNAGYDFGMFRLEGELGYKSVKSRNPTLSNTFVTAINTGAGTTYTTTTDFNLGRRTTVWSGMANALLDLGGNGGIGGFAGAGAGYASVHQFGSGSGHFAWQLLAGVYAPVTPNLDIGLKYRYFHAGRNNGSTTYAFATGATTCGTFACSPGVATFTNGDRYTSHSLMLNLTYNLGARAAVVPAAAPPPPPPPPAPAAPATQTCPDGSVIDATATCPAPPPPPPPPAPAARGERG
jgi:opacity protein-like surface antigen